MARSMPIAESSYPEARESFQCFKCLELPVDEVFICENSDLICSRCSQGLRSCPACKVRYDNPKIRLREVEQFLDRLKLHCPHRAKGCLEDLSRRNYHDHMNICHFNAKHVQLCKELGYNCDFKLNASDPRQVLEVAAHYRNGHHARIESKAYSKFLFLNVVDIESADTNEAALGPTLVSIGNDSFLLIKMSLTVEALQVAMIYLGTAAQEMAKYSILIQIANQIDPDTLLEIESAPATVAHLPETPSGVKIALGFLKDERNGSAADLLEIKVEVRSK